MASQVRKGTWGVIEYFLSDPLVGERLKDPACVNLMISWDLGGRLGDGDAGWIWERDVKI